MERDVSVLTGAAILAMALGVGLILGALVKPLVGVGAAVLVLGVALWLLAGALTPPVVVREVAPPTPLAEDIASVEVIG